MENRGEIVHLDHGAGGGLERLFLGNETITHDDIKKAAAKIVEKINAVVNPQERLSLLQKLGQLIGRKKVAVPKGPGPSAAFLLDDFFTTKFFERHFSENSVEEQGEIRFAADRLKNELVEELKKQITLYDSSASTSLENVLYSDINFATPEKIIKESDGIEREDFTIYSTLNEGKKHLLRADRLHPGEGFVVNERVREQGLEGRRALVKLPEHPNVVTARSMDKKSLLVDYKDFGSFDESMKKNPLPFSTTLKVVADTLRGAAFLAKNNLIIQDIALRNIGYYDAGKEGIQGLLFDIESVVPRGAQVFYQLGKKEYVAPDWLVVEAGGGFEESLPVYSFGLCLEKLSALPNVDEHTRAELKKLTKRMIEPLPNEAASRITLAEAETELRDIIKRIV